MANETAYPLCWPAGWKRAKSRKRAKFSTMGRTTEGRRGWAAQLSVAQGVERVVAELGRMGIDHWNVIVSTNIQVRRDGLPYSNQREPLDPGAAVYWQNRKDQRKCIAIDIYDRVADNLGAIAATLDAMRAIERHGGAEILERAFLGFQALPPPMTAGRPWSEVLGVDANCSLGAAETSYRIRAKQLHPDLSNGDHEKMAELNDAIRQAREVRE